MCRPGEDQITTSATTGSQQGQLPTRNDPHDGIIIRHYRPGQDNLPEMKTLLSDGLLILINVMIPVSFKLRWTSFSPLHPLVLAAPILAINVEGHHGHSQNWVEATVLYYLAAVAIISSITFLYYTLKSHQLFRGYVQYSLNSDMSNIPKVYQKDGGCFLVAILEDSIVGMVAGEYKSSTTISTSTSNGRNSNEVVKHERVYELRRMSVHTKMRGRGLGKRLLRRLEEELLKSKMTTMVLESSNLQHTAHYLYQRGGFQFEKTVDYPGPLGFELWRFRKNYN